MHVECVARLLCNRAGMRNLGRAEMIGTNVTIRIDADLARDARVFAARRGTSLSRLVGEQAYAAARRRALARLGRGYDLGGERPLSRDEVHEREGLR